MKNDGKTLVRALDMRCGGIKQMKMPDVGQLLVNDMSIDFIRETIMREALVVVFKQLNSHHYCFHQLLVKY